MKELKRITSPDGTLTLKVVQANDSTIVVGFEGGDWHTHPDLLHSWLGIDEDKAVEEFISQLTSDRLPILLSTDGGKTIDPWVSDDMAGTLEYYGKEHCVLRLWSGSEC